MSQPPSVVSSPALSPSDAPVRPAAGPLVPLPGRHRAASPTFLDLPRHVRDGIYWLTFYSDVLAWGTGLATFFPEVAREHCGLLLASRQVHGEASAVLRRSLALGRCPDEAYNLLVKLGAERIRQVRHLDLFHHCRELCHLGQKSGGDWSDVFELLWSSWALITTVDVHYMSCSGLKWPGKTLADTKACSLDWDEEDGWFWPGLERLHMARAIRFPGFTPEYFVRRLAKRLGWRMQGEVGWLGPGESCVSAFKGGIVNSTYPNDWDAIQMSHQILDKGQDESDIDYDQILRDICEKKTAGQRPTDDRLAAGRRATNLLDLPTEVRCHIFDLACEWERRAYWPSQPATWNTGAGILRVSKQIHADALPSAYRTFLVQGGRPRETLLRLAPKLAHVRSLQLNWCCFCPWHNHPACFNNGTIFAVRERDSDNVATLGEDGRCTGKPPRAKDLKRYQNQWTQTMSRIQAHPGLAELAVNFRSCCHSRSSHGPQRQEYCDDLLDHFSDLLCRCSDGVETLTLAGDVPLGLALRLATQRTCSDYHAPRRIILSANKAMTAAASNYLAARGARESQRWWSEQEEWEARPRFTTDCESLKVVFGWSLSARRLWSWNMGGGRLEGRWEGLRLERLLAGAEERGQEE